ncbi:MAG TPA: hypothetical protein VGN16_19670 [Acidobacteriaceae bacterium]
MNAIEEICSNDTGRFLRALIEIEDEGNAEFEREHLIVQIDGGYVVGGVVRVKTLDEALELVAA